MSAVDLLAALMADTEWQARSACRPAASGLASEAFMPTLHDKHATRETWDPQPALACCEACTVRQECGGYADRQGIKFGVWGGRLRGRSPDCVNRLRQRDRMHLPPVRRSA